MHWRRWPLRYGVSTLSRRRAAHCAPRFGHDEGIQPCGSAHGVRAYRGGIAVEGQGTTDDSEGECRKAAMP